MNIAEIFQEAKEAILRDGELHAVVYAELATDGMLMMMFADFPFETTAQKKKALFDLGRAQGKEHGGDELRQLCFVCEAWLSQYKVGEEPRAAAPSKDPERKEAIIVVVLDVISKKSIKQSAYAAEMIRDGFGHLVDLLPYDLRESNVDSGLLTSFQLGFESAVISDEELAVTMASAIMKSSN